MDETKEHLKQLIDFFTGLYLSRQIFDTDLFDSNVAGGGATRSGSLGDSDPSPVQTMYPILRQDINLIIKTLELWYVLIVI